MPSRHLLNALSVFRIIRYGKLFLNNPSHLASDEKDEYAIIMLTYILETIVKSYPDNEKAAFNFNCLFKFIECTIF